MQALPNTQRSTQRRSPAVEPNPPPNAPLPAASNSAEPRNSSASSRSSISRRQNPSQQLSQIERSVTHLLVATKSLLETLTQWSRQTATEAEVSDIYVRLGYEFNIACRAFTAIGVETTDLGPVPDLLRGILEETLSQEATPASLDRFLPRIRDIIINLLHGLKRKQQKLRSKQAKESSSAQENSGIATRHISSGSAKSSDTGLTKMLEDVPSSRSGSKTTDRRQDSHDSAKTLVGQDNAGVPPRVSSVQDGAGSSSQREQTVSSANEGRTLNRDQSFLSSNSGSSISSNTMQNIPVLAPFSQEEILPRPSEISHSANLPPPPPAPPQPRQQDALAALQRGGDLERRASRRYSAYQISKHLGASPNGLPMLPPPQHSPIPNRGRDVRESLNAVRVRGSLINGRQRSANRAGEPSPTRNTAISQRISEESNLSNRSNPPTFHPPADSEPHDSPIEKTPEDKLRHSFETAEGHKPLAGASFNASNSEDARTSPAYDLTEDNRTDTSRRQKRRGFDDRLNATSKIEDSQTQPMNVAQPQEFLPEQSPQPGKELTLFLQYKSKIKKFVLSDGASDLSIARLQLAFIEKFAWNTHSNGNDLPEIYIQDPASGVRHELEDLGDVKDRSVLVLNVEILDEVKKHIDEGLSGLRRMVEGVRTVVDGQQSAIQRVSDKQQETSKDIFRLATIQPRLNFRTQSSEAPKPSAIRSPASTPSKRSSSQLSETKTARRDLAIIRQTFSTFVTDMSSSMTDFQEKASSVKSVALDTTIPSVDSSRGRAYVNVGKKAISEESERIVNRVDDLQDVVEDLRKDVVTRGVRPMPRQLETVSRDISTATAELKKLLEYLKREKPIWTKIWEKELELVCTDRDLLTMQEELAADLEDDLEKATQTFALVEQATKQQHLQASQGSGMHPRNTSRGLTAIASDPEIDPIKAKDGVLGEVRALQPNHETRLEAIERAEKTRQKELESRREGEFKEELGTFIEEGKLRKSGGVDETERLRKAKDERNRKEAWEKQQIRAAGKGKEREPDSTTEEKQQEEQAPVEESFGQPESTNVRAREQLPELSPSKPTSWLPAIFTS